MKRLALAATIAVLLLPGVARAGAATDAALGLGAFAVFNQILSGTGITGRAPAVAAPAPLVDGLPAPTDTREFVTLELVTDQGLTGVGLTFFGGALTPALRAAVDGLARLVIGDDPAQTETIAAKCRRAAGSSGPGGIYTLA